MKSFGLDEKPSDIELVYSYLLSHNMNVKDKVMQERIMNCICLFEELWPVETKRWRDFNKS